jgi:hypothetical protein
LRQLFDWNVVRTEIIQGKHDLLIVYQSNLRRYNAGSLIKYLINMDSKNNF